MSCQRDQSAGDCGPQSCASARLPALRHAERLRGSTSGQERMRGRKVVSAAQGATVSWWIGAPQSGSFLRNRKAAAQDNEPRVATMRGGDGRIPNPRTKTEVTSPRLLFYFSLSTAAPLRGAYRRGRILCRRPDVLEHCAWRPARGTRVRQAQQKCAGRRGGLLLRGVGPDILKTRISVEIAIHLAFRRDQQLYADTRVPPQ